MVLERTKMMVCNFKRAATAAKDKNHQYPFEKDPGTGFFDPENDFIDDICHNQDIQHIRYANGRTYKFCDAQTTEKAVQKIHCITPDSSDSNKNWFQKADTVSVYHKVEQKCGSLVKFKKFMIFFIRENRRESSSLSKRLLFGHENTPQDILSNKRGVISYFDL